jgi:hypothetical protein
VLPSGPARPAPPGSNSGWAIQPAEKMKYDKLFDSLEPVNGLIPGNKVCFQHLAWVIAQYPIYCKTLWLELALYQSKHIAQLNFFAVPWCIFILIALHFLRSKAL